MTTNTQTMKSQKVVLNVQTIIKLKSAVENAINNNINEEQLYQEMIKIDNYIIDKSDIKNSSWKNYYYWVLMHNLNLLLQVMRQLQQLYLY